MIQDIQKLLDEYLAWLKDKTQLRQIEQWVEITTPYLDRHNDYIQIYARKANGDYTLTDDGYTIGDLEQSGCKLSSPKRQDLLKMTLNGFGVQMVDQRLEVRASNDNFALNDMFYMALPMVASLFYEDVVAWLDLHEIRYTPKVKFTGKSGYDHLFDFVIPKSRYQPERILQAINRPNRDTAQVVAFSWIDTKEVRPTDSKAYAVLNDSEQKISAAVTDALRNYDVQPIPWRDRDQVLEELAA
jgi:hypothetical protein